MATPDETAGGAPNKEASGALSSLTGIIKSLAGAFTSLKSSLSGIAEGPIQALSGGFSKLTDILAEQAKEQPAVVKGLTSNLMSLSSIVTDISGQFTSLAAPFMKFVGALSPGTLQLFAINLRDLNATIGTAVLPIVEEVSVALREAAGIIKQTMAELAPVLRDLTHSILSLLLDSLRSLMRWLQFFMPILKTLAELMRFLVDLWVTVNDIVRALYDVLAPAIILLSELFIKFVLFGDILKEVAITLLLMMGPVGWLILAIGYVVTHINEVTKGLQAFIVNMTRGVAVLMALTGSGTLLGAMIKKLQEQQKAKEGGVGGAIQDVGLKGFEQIGKDLAMAASYAGGGGSGKATLEDTLPQIIQGMQDGQAYAEQLKEQLFKLLKDLPGEIAKAIVGAPAAQAKEAVHHALDPVATDSNLQLGLKVGARVILPKALGGY